MLVLEGLLGSALQNRARPTAIHLKRQYLGLVKENKKTGDTIPLVGLTKHFHAKGPRAKELVATVAHLGLLRCAFVNG